jgi:hypothetical protein
MNKPMSQTLTCGHLVYVRTFKCASTFYWNSFKEFGWQEINFDSIDWKHQHVFSHIMEPEQRRHKGVAEYIHTHNAYDLFYNNETFSKFIARIHALDQHSLSYHDQYGNYCNLIDWIPLSGSSHGFTWWLTHEESKAKTDLFLQHHGIKVFNRWAWNQSRRSSDQQKKLEKDLEELWNNYQPEWGDWYLNRDRELYNRVISKFNYEAATWAESTWLR